MEYAVVSIGDVNSKAPGSGARFNSGKPRLDLIPAGIVADFLAAAGADPGAVVSNEGRALNALRRLSDYQMSGDYHSLLHAGVALYGWDIDMGLADAANVFEYGIQKYAAWNWSKGMDWSVPIGCAMRHLVAMHRGERLDPESGLPHSGHVLCNLIMLLHYKYWWQDGNDLPWEYHSERKAPATRPFPSSPAPSTPWVEDSGAPTAAPEYRARPSQGFLHGGDRPAFPRGDIPVWLQAKESDTP